MNNNSEHKSLLAPFIEWAYLYPKVFISFADSTAMDKSYFR